MHYLFAALGQSALGHYMQTSVWAFAVVETIHLLALAVLGGSVLIVDLRLLGILFRGESVRILGRDLNRLLAGSLTVMILSGIAMVSEEALKCYYSPAFRWKMAMLLAAILFHLTVHRKVMAQTDRSIPALGSRAAAAISLALWLGVGVAGRAIGFL
jgi:hypothetical protein